MGTAGSSLDLPADLIDRAVDTLDAYVPFTPGARSEMGLAVCDLAPLLVEHGRQQERQGWLDGPSWSIDHLARCLRAEMAVLNRWPAGWETSRLAAALAAAGKDGGQ